MSRCPWNWTVLFGRMVRVEYEEPPRTRSEEEVQYVRDHRLYNISYVRSEQGDLLVASKEESVG